MKSANIALSHLTVPFSSNNGLYNAELSFRSFTFWPGVQPQIKVNDCLKHPS